MHACAQMCRSRQKCPGDFMRPRPRARTPLVGHLSGSMWPMASSGCPRVQAAGGGGGAQIVCGQAMCCCSVVFKKQNETEEEKKSQDPSVFSVVQILYFSILAPIRYRSCI